MDKEQAYDEQLNPLMAEIIAICREHHIGMIAHFCIPTEADEGLCCTTHLPDESGELPPSVKVMARAAKGPPPMMLTTRNAEGQITNVTAIL